MRQCTVDSCVLTRWGCVSQGQAEIASQNRSETRKQLLAEHAYLPYDFWPTFRTSAPAASKTNGESISLQEKNTRAQ